MRGAIVTDDKESDILLVMEVLYKLLKRLEWSGGETERKCPICFAHAGDEHRPGCELADCIYALGRLQP